MEKIAKQLMSIASDYKLAETKEEIKNILGSVQIRMAEDNDANIDVLQGEMDKAVDEGKDALNEAKNEQDPQKKQKAVEEAEKWFEEAKEKLKKAEEIKKDISVIRDRLAKEVSNWNSCLKEIKKIFSGDDGFEQVISALTNDQYFKKIGIKLSQSFKNIYEQVKDYNIKKMDDKKFIELVNDSKSGYMTNLIDPFVDLYNGYMDKFEELEKLYEELVKEKQKELANLGVPAGDQFKLDENNENGDGIPYTQVIEEKHKFSKKLFKIASELENILD